MKKNIFVCQYELSYCSRAYLFFNVISQILCDIILCVNELTKSIIRKMNTNIMPHYLANKVEEYCYRIESHPVLYPLR